MDVFWKTKNFHIIRTTRVMYYSITASYHGFWVPRCHVMELVHFLLPVKIVRSQTSPHGTRISCRLRSRSRLGITCFYVSSRPLKFNNARGVSDRKNNLCFFSFPCPLALVSPPVPDSNCISLSVFGICMYSCAYPCKTNWFPVWKSSIVRSVRWLIRPIPNIYVQRNLKTNPTVLRSILRRVSCVLFRNYFFSGLGLLMSYAFDLI